MQILHNIKEPLIELNNMIGMNDLKNNITDQILYFLQELNKNNDNSCDFMHTVIYGPPGTGKTEIAKIMGKIYSKIGILNKGTFRKVTRADLVSGYLGQTALKTRDVIKDSLGGVLFIDEAYALGNNEKKDSFSKECIDTLCEALSDHKHELMVIIAGYESELKECFFKYNQGLDSRFTWRFSTDEYKADDLYKIFLKKLNDIGWVISEDSNINVEWFKKNMDYFKFFGRDMETLLAKTKIAHSKRVFCKQESEKKKINLVDLNKGFELYLKNDDVKNRKESANFNKSLQYIYV
jgi:SpoVK/Ycf46/Vps4 family AAA+-type ATPase